MSAYAEMMSRLFSPGSKRTRASVPLKQLVLEQLERRLTACWIVICVDVAVVMQNDEGCARFVRKMM